MISTINTISESKISDLYDLKYEVHEAYINKASYMVREQVIRFENIYRHYSNLYDLNARYGKAVMDMKLLLFRQSDYPSVQKRLLEEVRRLTLDVNYLS